MSHTSTTVNGKKKTTMFKELLHSGKTEFIMEAHNGLSAKIAENAGFKGIWGSGLSISASMCVRDSNEASWTQVVDVCEYMCDATSVPILLDGDTGFGNYNNARRLVNKLIDRGVAAVAIEEKLFPKTNSLLEGVAQPLATVEEFSLKIKAIKDCQKDPDFCVVARIEALIAGWGTDEALRRARAYVKAGADAILIHSKKPTFDGEGAIKDFLVQFNNEIPVVIVPTTYSMSTPTDVFREHGVSVIIWANMQMRAMVTACQEVCKTLKEEETLTNVQNNIVSVKHVFGLTNDPELRAADKKYCVGPDSVKIPGANE